MLRGELGSARRRFARAIEYARGSRHGRPRRSRRCTTSATPSSSPAACPTRCGPWTRRASRCRHLARGLAARPRAGAGRGRSRARGRRIRWPPPPRSSARTGSPQDLAETELERARCALIAGQVQASRRFAMRARDRFRRRGSDRWRRDAELVLLQGDLAAGRPGRRLTGPALRLRQEFERDGARLPAQTAALIAAEAHLAAGELEAATADAGATSRPPPAATRSRPGCTPATCARASTSPQDGTAAASRRARRALADLAAYQASFGSIDLATAAAVHGRRLADLDLAVALGSGRPERVLESAERARAVASRLPAVRPPDDPEAAELLAELRQTVEALRQAAQNHQRRRRAAGAAPRTGGARSPRVAGAGPGAAWCASRRGRRSCGPRSATRRSSPSRAPAARCTRSSSTPRGLRLVALGERRSHRRAGAPGARRPRRARPATPAGPAARGRLGVAAPTRLRCSTRRCSRRCGSSGGWSWCRPACSASCRGGCCRSLRGVPVVVTPSVTAWHGAATRGSRSRSRRVGGDRRPRGRPRQRRGRLGRARLGRARRSRAITGAAATAAAVHRQRCHSARLAHVAAHGVHQTENPLFSSVRLADGPLFAHELDQSTRTPEHVVLSACELGLATVRPGDEALGLTSVLLHLGTRSVVAGVARVSDDLAAASMADYHARLRAGSDSRAGARRDRCRRTPGCRSSASGPRCR